MDIMMPPLAEQPAPAPWLARREQVDLAATIREILERGTAAQVAEVVEELHRRQIDVDGIAVATWIKKLSRIYPQSRHGGFP